MRLWQVAMVVLMFGAMVVIDKYTNFFDWMYKYEREILQNI